MRKIQHLFLKVAQEAVKNRALSEVLEKQLKLPKRVFPPSFQVKKKDFFCGGYFVCYNRKISFEGVADKCKSGSWKFLAGLVADFFIIYCDFSNNRIFVLTDQLGKFPCFFSVSGGQLTLSTDFATIKDNLPFLTLNVSAALDYIADNQFGVLGDQTIISEIHKVPPGTLLVIEKDLSYSLEPLIDLERFLSQKQPTYRSVKEFADSFLLLFKQLVAQRLDALGNLRFAVDLSSGFDSSLVCYLVKQLSDNPFNCYAMVSRHTTEDTDPVIIKEFSQKHSLNTKFVNVDEYSPFAKKHDLQWNIKYPIDAMVEAYFHFLLQKGEGGNMASFGGDGGDEAYLSFKMDKLASFPIQNEYFLTIERLQKYHLGEILTQKGVVEVLSRNRFAKKKAYPACLSPSVVNGSLLLFPLYWEAGVWPLTPFADPRLVQFARRIPHRGMNAPNRHAVWKGRDQIFVPSQFRSKIGPDKFIKLFLTKEVDFIVSVLKKSVLAGKGWVNSLKIAEEIQKGNVGKYSGDALVYLHNLIRLEYFLQNNRVRIQE